MALTEDVLFQILLNLNDKKEYDDLMIVNKTINRVLNDHHFWKTKIEHDWQISIDTPSMVTWEKLKDIERQQIPQFLNRLKYEDQQFNFKGDLTIIHNILFIDKKHTTNNGTVFIYFEKRNDQYHVKVIDSDDNTLSYFKSFKQVFQLLLQLFYFFKYIKRRSAIGTRYIQSINGIF